jgi:hypothetical protein
VHASVLAHRWVFRRHWWILVLGALLGALLVPLMSVTRSPSYEAGALVVAQTWPQSVVALPRYGQSIFSSGAVAQRVATELDLDSPSALVPGHLRVETPQDSLVYTVVGIDADPDRATQIANLGAEAFVAELNKGGPTVGVFAVQSQATPPSEPAAQGLGNRVAVVVGVIAGLVFGMGLLLLLVLTRRPIVGLGDVLDELDVPGLALLTLPGARQAPVEPEAVQGLARLARAVLDSPATTVMLVSDDGDATAREQVAQALALALGSGRPVVYLGRGETEARVNQALRVAGDHVPGADKADRLVVVDVQSPLETLTVRDTAWTVVLVGPSGSGRARFDSLLADFRRDQVLGVALFRRGRRRRSAPSAATVRGTLREEAPSVR